MQKKGIIKPELVRSTAQKIRDKSTITTETLPLTSSRKKANELVSMAGKIIQENSPSLANSVHVGSLVIHIYQDKSEYKPSFASNVLFADDRDPAETYAGMAVDELRRKAMSHFERKPTGGH